MDPATILALEQAVSAAVSIYQQAQAGTITEAQAQALLTQASTSLKSAIDTFNQAGN